MEDSLQDGALCLICHESLLGQVPCALRCGHVYHSVCCHQWFEKGKGECPQCKARSGRDELLLLDFEVAAVRPRSLEEVRKLEAASAEERGQLREELALELEDAEARSGETGTRLDEHREAAQDRKRARRELECRAPEAEAEIKRLKAEREQLTMSNASLSAKVDEQNSRQRQARSRPRGKSQDSIQDEDHDSKEERRKLRVMRPADRARQLHEAVVSAGRQEAEASRANRQREAAFKELEAELSELRKVEVKLLADLRRVKEREEFAAEAGTTAAEQRKASFAVQPAPGVRALKKSRSAAPPTAEPRTGSAAGGTAAETSAGLDIFGDEDMLYGGPPVRRTAPASLLLASRPRAAATGTGPARPAAPAAAMMASLATPIRKQSNLQALFSKRQA